MSFLVDNVCEVEEVGHPVKNGEIFFVSKSVGGERIGILGIVLEFSISVVFPNRTVVLAAEQTGGRVCSAAAVSPLSA